MRIAVAILNLCGLALYGLILSFGIGGGGGGAGAGTGQPNSLDALATVYPLAYFLTCFCTIFARQQSLVVRNIGIAAHALLALVVIGIGVNVSLEGALPFAVISLIFGCIWFGMFYGLPEPPPPTEPPNDSISN